MSRKKPPAAVGVAATLMHHAERAPGEPWRILLHVTAGGRCSAMDWYLGLTKRGQARADVRLKHLRVQPKGRWERPHAVAIGHHMYVIHIQDENRTQHRLVGWFDGEHHAFVISVVAIEKDGKYDPDDYEHRTTLCRDELAGQVSVRTVECDWGRA